MKKAITTLYILFLLNQVSIAQTWADNVACIFYTHCTSCHNDKGIAPFSLITYQEAADNAASILSSVVSKHMPPWPSDESYQQHARARTLKPKEIDLIKKWVNAGAPQGNPSHAPKPPVYDGKSAITNPELIVKMPLYKVSTTEDLYRCFVIPPSINIDKYITAFEAIPGDRNIVHHVLVYQDTTTIPLLLDTLDPGPGYTSFGGIGSPAAKLIGAWVPGSQPYILPAGMGIKLSAKSNIVMQIHYPAGTTSKVDSTLINLRLSNGPLRNVNIDPAINHSSSITDGPLFIPANQVKTFHALHVTQENYTVLGVAPHMHLIGKSIKSYAITPSKDTINLINIPDWHFHWQGEYQFKKPIKIPKGTFVIAEATYDNTTNNHHNPNNPPKDVSVGEKTTDEMLLIYFSYLIYKDGDENIPIDTSTVTPYFKGCSITSDVPKFTSASNDGIQIYPNPASSIITGNWELSSPQHVKIELFDIGGTKLKTLLNEKVNSGQQEVNIDLKDLNSGIYFIRLQKSDKVITKRIVKL